MEPLKTVDSGDKDDLCQTPTFFPVADAVSDAVDMDSGASKEEAEYVRQANQSENETGEEGMSFAFAGMDAFTGVGGFFNTELPIPIWPGSMAGVVPNSLQMDYYPTSSLSQPFGPESFWDLQLGEPSNVQYDSALLSTENGLWIQQNPLPTQPQVTPASFNMAVPGGTWHQQVALPVSDDHCGGFVTSPTASSKETTEPAVSPTASATLKSPVSTTATTATTVSNQSQPSVQPIATGSQTNKVKNTETPELTTPSAAALLGTFSNAAPISTSLLSDGVSFMPQAGPSALNSSGVFPIGAFPSSNASFATATGSFPTDATYPLPSASAWPTDPLGFPPPMTPTLSAFLQNCNRFEKQASNVVAPIFEAVPAQVWPSPFSAAQTAASARHYAAQTSTRNPLSTPTPGLEVVPPRMPPSQSNMVSNEVNCFPTTSDSSTFFTAFDSSGTNQAQTKPVPSISSTREATPQRFEFSAPPRFPSMAGDNSTQTYADLQPRACSKVPTPAARKGKPSKPVAAPLSSSCPLAPPKTTIEFPQPRPTSPRLNETSNENVTASCLQSSRRTSRSPGERVRPRKTKSTTVPSATTVEDVPEMPRQPRPEVPKPPPAEAAPGPELPSKSSTKDPAMGAPFFASTPRGQIPFQAWVPPPAKYKFAGEPIPTYIPEAGPFPPPGHPLAADPKPRPMAKPKSQKAKAEAQKVKAKPPPASSGVKSNAKEPCSKSIAQPPNAFFQGGVLRSTLNQPTHFTTDELNFGPFASRPVPVPQNHPPPQTVPPATTTVSGSAKRSSRAKASARRMPLSTSVTAMPPLAPRKTQQQAPTIRFAAPRISYMPPANQGRYNIQEDPQNDVSDL